MAIEVSNLTDGILGLESSIIPFGGSVIIPIETARTKELLAKSKIAVATVADPNVYPATPAGENHIGEVGGNTGVVSATTTVQAAAYATGQCIGGKLTFPNMARIVAGSGLIQMAMVQCKSAQSTSMDLVFFHADPIATTIIDRSAFNLNAADFDKVAATFHINDWTALGTASLGRSVESQVFKIAAGQTSGFGVLIARGSLSLASTSDIAVVLKTMRD